MRRPPQDLGSSRQSIKGCSRASVFIVWLLITKLPALVSHLIASIACAMVTLLTIVVRRWTYGGDQVSTLS
jgi:hypothetical protein